MKILVTVFVLVLVILMTTCETWLLAVLHGSDSDLHDKENLAHEINVATTETLGKAYIWSAIQVLLIFQK